MRPEDLRMIFVTGHGIGCSNPTNAGATGQWTDTGTLWRWYQKPYEQLSPVVLEWAERLDTVFQQALSTALTFSYVDLRVPMEGISMEAHPS
jgi:hypothetical protein